MNHNLEKNGLVPNVQIYKNLIEKYLFFKNKDI